MIRTIQPAGRIAGRVRLPGDKSISHRYAMLAAIAEGRSVIEHYSTGADCASTLACLRALGARIEHTENRVTVDGAGLGGLRQAAGPLDAGNSGSTMRMLAGILAGQSFESTIGGDESLSKRPMGRIITPLSRMGARIEAREGGFPPLRIHGGTVEPLVYDLPVASAQVKTAVLFAGLYAGGVTVVREPLRTRNHSELALREFGVEIETNGLEVRLRGRPRLRGQNLSVPSDLSSAAFFIGAALLLPGSDVTLEGVGLNPTRTTLLDVLRGMGARIEIVASSNQGGETTGDLHVEGPKTGGEPVLAGGRIEGAVTAGVIDEIPMLAVLGAVSRDGLDIRDAAELRVKETDRIQTVVENLRRMGIRVEDRADGMTIPGGQRFQGAELDSFGDHRIAMAFTIAGLCADEPSTLAGAEAAAVSFPEFYDLLDSVIES